ncbi:hypothetical protein [Paracoccus tegillarcae]|uniref:Uncharacterized protein n=1 Tax=Paracoccus tegillarcae TaxID=1529068 RepID=A0A2K9EKJ0_9RHOB|nr:hypothetical protein [Paracoccus tegillarcae]AUH34929.1 hypothetical protein CUV01_17470 [Paracoccus tegillarcae]
MREFFINWSERLITAFVVMGGLFVLIAGLGAMFSGMPGGFWRGLGILVGGSIYLMVAAGFMYVAFGIYRNTQETNRLLAELLRK